MAKKKSILIKSSRHYLNNLNSSKQDLLIIILNEARSACSEFINTLWNTLDIPNQNFYIDKHPHYNILKNPETICPNLSARLLSSIAAQASGIIRSETSKITKLQWQIQKNIKQNLDVSYLQENLQPLISNLIKPKLPQLSHFKLELSSKNIDFIDDFKNYKQKKSSKTNTIVSAYVKNLLPKPPNKSKTQSGKNDYFVKLKSTGFDFILLPIQLHKHDRKLLAKGYTRKSSVLLGYNSIEIRYEKEKPALKTSGELLGCDSGARAVITLAKASDKSITNTSFEDPHHHTFDSILKKIARKQRGSKSYQRALAHRSNFINRSIKLLDLSGTKQVNFEHIENIRHGKSAGRYLNAWVHAEIEQRFMRECEEQGVLVSLQDSAYYSQRCSGCGFVHKKNRKSGGEEFECVGCGHRLNADANAALNHLEMLPKISISFRKQKHNITGFYWLSDGLEIVETIDSSSYVKKVVNEEFSKSVAKEDL